MAKKSEPDITCTIELTEGAEQRFTEAMQDLYYGILDGIYDGPPLLDYYEKEKPA